MIIRLRGPIPIFNPHSFALEIHTSIEDQVSRGFIIINWDLDPSSNILKATFKFSISLCIASIHRDFTFLSSNFLVWETEVGSSMSMFVCDFACPLIDCRYNEISKTKSAGHSPLKCRIIINFSGN